MKNRTTNAGATAPDTSSAALCGKYVNLMNDVAFQWVFGRESNKDLLIALLNELIAGVHKGNTVSANSNVSEMINIFKYAADVFSDREWGLYRNEDIYELTTKNNESSVITSLDNVLWKIHSHPNVEPKYKDEIDSMGFLLPDSAFNPDGSIRKGEYDVSYTGDVFNYNKNYEISNGRPCKSQVYFPVSGNCYNIVYKSIPRPIHLQR